MNKTELLAHLLVRHGSIDKYVILREDERGRHFEYAFKQGCPENCNCLPAWASELPVNNIYKLSGWTGDHWALCGGQPVDVDKLMSEKYEMSVDDIMNLSAEI